MMKQEIDYKEVPKIYQSLVRGIEILDKTNVNSLVVKGSQGIGKSWWVDYAVNGINCDYTLFKGTVSEARFYKFIQDNSDKMIIMRDCGNLLRRLSFLDFLKSATDTISIRTISRLNYSKYEDVEETIEFKGKIIWEINEVTKKNKEDLAAVFDRSIFIELNPSKQDIINIMYSICKTKEEKMVTDYIIKKFNYHNLNSLNLRTQNKCFLIYQVAVKDKLDWQKQIDLFINTDLSEGRKFLYRFTGLNPCKRIDFAKYLMTQGLSYVTSQRRIKEWLYLEEIFSNNKMKQALLCIKPIELEGGKIK